MTIIFKSDFPEDNIIHGKMMLFEAYELFLTKHQKDPLFENSIKTNHNSLGFNVNPLTPFSKGDLVGCQ